MHALFRRNTNDEEEAGEQNHDDESHSAHPHPRCLSLSRPRMDFPPIRWCCCFYGSSDVESQLLSRSCRRVTEPSLLDLAVSLNRSEKVDLIFERRKVPVVNGSMLRS